MPGSLQKGAKRALLHQASVSNLLQADIICLLPVCCWSRCSYTSRLNPPQLWLHNSHTDGFITVLYAIFETV